ncbi:MAG: hypothetical protein BRD39_03590 [Bacteroidetes bacterium QH_9_64_21]|nr:MAG: hypothetical protein BRD39_03590 [Bacteroidetes bacterium QH_9_64_21]
MSKHEDWVSIFRSSTDYEADLVRDRLDDSGIPAVVLTQRDHAFNLTVGDLASVHVRPAPEAPPANTPDEDSKLDSGHEHMDLGPPDEDEDSSA